MNRLEGIVAIVTGTGQGLGLAVAELFASEGAKVIGQKGTNAWFCPTLA